MAVVTCILRIYLSIIQNKKDFFLLIQKTHLFKIYQDRYRSSNSFKKPIHFDPKIKQDF